MLSRPLILFALASTTTWATAQPTPFRIVSDPKFQATANAFVKDWGIPIHISAEPLLATEEYRLTVGKAITVKPSTSVGAAWALSTLGVSLQSGKFEAFTIREKPLFEVRGLVLDVARRYHSPSTLRTLIRWCNVAKVRTVQLHLTDDQNWMLPSKALPGIDKNNIHGKPAYTEKELKDLQAFAEARGVSIVPEIDLPGHSSLLVKSNPSLFQIQGSESTNCVNFGSPLVRKKLKELLSEVYRLFPKSPYIHIGGDEAWYSNAEKDPQMAASAKKLGGSTHEVFVDFVAELAEHVIASGRTPIVWEGFSASEFVRKRIPKKTLVVAWEGPYYPVTRLVPDGFQVINAGWDPFYIVNHYPYDVNTLVPLERLLNSSLLSFGTMQWNRPGVGVFQFQEASAVKGSLLCWWEGHEWNAQTILPARIFAFGLLSWNRGKGLSYDSVVSKWSAISAAMEEPRLGFNVAVSGTVPTSSSQFTQEANFQFVSRQKDVRYAVRTDGQTPTLKDVITGDSYRVKDSANLAVQAYRGSKPLGETFFAPVKKVSINRSLTTGGKISVSEARDPQFSAENLVDGISDDPTGYWLAYPCPQYATIDLGKVQSVSEVQVVAVWQNAAIAYYRVEGSVDGKTWQGLVDRASNSDPATPNGYRDKFSPAQVRYLRLQAIGGTLFPNPVARILEVRAFGP